MPDHSIGIRVIVNGQPVQVKASPHQPLIPVVNKALNESGNSGQPLENWELRDASGQVLDLHKKVGDYGFTDGVKLFLNLKAGVGG